MSLRTTENWKSIIRMRTLKELPYQVLGDLTGYPMRSKWKDDDAATLGNFIAALIDLAQHKEI